MSGQTFSTFTEVGMIDARTKAGAITLPTTTSIPYRILTLKDVYGATGTNSVLLSTQTGDTFEDGTTTRAINAAWGMTTLYAGKPGTWYTIGGSVLTTANISSLTVSSIFGLQGFVSTPYLQSQLATTVAGLGTAGYLSSVNIVTLPGGLVSTANLTNLVSTSYLQTQLGSTVIGLGTAGYLSTSTPFTGSTNQLSAGTITANTLQLYSYLNMTGGNLSNVAAEYFTTPKYTTTFTPTSISGLKVWLDASQLTTITSNGSSQVLSLSNLTGLGNATAPALSNAPLTGQ